MEVKSEFKIGDRVWFIYLGWDCATVVEVEPLTIKFHNSEKPIKIPERHQQWLIPYVQYSMPNVGDTIKINEKHFVCAGKDFVVAEIQKGGWVKTTDGNLFHFDFFSILSLTA